MTTALKIQQRVSEPEENRVVGKVKGVIFRPLKYEIGRCCRSQQAATLD